MNQQTSQSGLQQGASPVGTHKGYMPGFGNDFETEALPGALPQGMNSPQRCNYGLYGEQLSGTAFTAPSHQNERDVVLPGTAFGEAHAPVPKDRHAALENGAACARERDIAGPIPLGSRTAYRRRANLVDRDAHHDHRG